jgi:hypothetical protein
LSGNPTVHHRPDLHRLDPVRSSSEVDASWTQLAYSNFFGTIGLEICGCGSWAKTELRPESRNRNSEVRVCSGELTVTEWDFIVGKVSNVIGGALLYY